MSTEREFRCFFQQTFPLELLQQRYKIVDDLGRYVLRGVMDRYARSPAHPSAKPFSDSIDAVWMRTFSQMVVVPKKQQALYFSPTNTAEHVFHAFEEAARYAREPISAIPHFTNEALAKEFGEKFGVTTINAGGTCKPSVHACYRMAMDNIKQTKTRLVALGAIFNLCRWSEYTTAELAGADAIRATLWQNLATYQRHAVAFGLLMGGQQAKEVAQMLVNETMYDPKADINYSLVQFRHADENMPGSWSGTEDEKLRADIVERYEAL